MGLWTVQFRHSCKERCTTLCPAPQSSESLEAFAAARCLSAAHRNCPASLAGRVTFSPWSGHPTPHLQETLFLPDSPWYYLWWSSRCLFLKDSVGIVYSHYDAPHYVTFCDPASWCERRACCLVLCWSGSTSIGNLPCRVRHQPDSSCAHDPGPAARHGRRGC